MEKTLDINKIPETEQEAKAIAKVLLEQTDYAVLSDVEIKNRDEFVNYRAALRSVLSSPKMPVFFSNPPEPIWVE